LFRKQLAAVFCSAPSIGVVVVIWWSTPVLHVRPPSVDRSA